MCILNHTLCHIFGYLGLVAIFILLIKIGVDWIYRDTKRKDISKMSNDELTKLINNEINNAISKKTKKVDDNCKFFSATVDGNFNDAVKDMKCFEEEIKDLLDLVNAKKSECIEDRNTYTTIDLTKDFVPYEVASERSGIDIETIRTWADYGYIGRILFRRSPLVSLQDMKDYINKNHIKCKLYQENKTK